MKNDELKNPEELSVQQKIWKGTEVFLYSIRPLLLYLFLPPLLMTAGTALFGGRTTQEVIIGSGNFYNALGILLTIYLLYRRSVKKGSSLKEDTTLELDELNRKKIAYLLITGFGFGFFFSAVVTVIPFPEFMMASYRDSSGVFRDGADQWLALLSTTLLAPVVEELVFRGYMLNRLLTWFKELHAMLIVSAVFALCHVSPIWIVYAFLMGVILTKVSIAEDNIAYSIALHIGFNMNVLPIWLINHNEVLNEMLFSSNLLIAVYGIVSCLIAIWFLEKYRRETKIW